MPASGLFDFPKAKDLFADVPPVALVADVFAERVTAVNVFNCFSNAYASYRIIGHTSAWSADNNLMAIRYMNSDGPYAANQYDFGMTYAQGSTRATEASVLRTYARVGYGQTSSGWSGFIMNVTNPATAVRTQTQHCFCAFPASGAATLYENGNSQTRVTDKFSGFQYFQVAPGGSSAIGTTLFSVRLSVYGFR